LLVGQFLVSDVGSDHFLIPTNDRDKVSARPEFVAKKIQHLAFDICASMIQVNRSCDSVISLKALAFPKEIL